MPRISKKITALIAAREIVEREGVAAVTYDLLAQESGLSKSGLVYHFPSRHDLLVELHRYCAERWEDELLDLADGDLSLAGRRRAVVLSMSKNDPAVELILSIHATTHPDFARPWQEVERRWQAFAQVDEQGIPLSAADDDRLTGFILSLGLWAFDHVNIVPLPAATRAHITARALALISAEPDSPEGTGHTEGPEPKI